MQDLWFLGGVLAAAGWLVSRKFVRRANQVAAANASGLVPVSDLTHVSSALQRTALWCLADGGFERRVVHGVLSRRAHDVDVTAFDLETLRERRGEWAWLPVDLPFRIGPVVSVVACELDRALPHVLFKHAGGGDELVDDNLIERAGSVAKSVRDGLGLARAYPAEMPGLPTAQLALPLPAGWRAYSADAGATAALLSAGFASTLAACARRDLVVELISDLVVVYPAARDVVGADALADLTTTALAIVDGLVEATPVISPRGVEVDHASGAAGAAGVSASDRDDVN